jgi:uncharacterized membrane protein YhaH (DUF805 family)
MTNPNAFNHWFTLSLSRKRLSFFLASLSVLAVLFISQKILIYFENPGLIIIFVIPAVAANVVLAAQRLRDMGFPVWLSIINLPQVFGEIIFSSNENVFFVWNCVVIIFLLLLYFCPSKSVDLIEDATG